MNRGEKDFFKKISAELKRDAENIILPDALSTESIAELIKNNADTVPLTEINTADTAYKGLRVLKTPTKKVLASAAALVLIIASAFAYKNLDRPLLSTDQSTEAGTEETSADSGIFASSSIIDENKGDSGNNVSDKKQGDNNVTEQYQVKVDGVKTASSYSEIESKIKKAYKKSSSTNLFSNFFGLFATKGSANDAAKPEEIVDESSLGSAPGFGKTNEQVTGVAEGDIIKNDGRYLYIFSNKGIQIVDTANNSLNKTALIKLNDINKVNTSGEASSSKVAYDYYYGSDVRELYVLNNRLAAISCGFESVYKDNTTQSKRVTNVTVFDISDKSNPQKILSYSQDGYYVSSRVYNGRLSLVTDYSIAYYGDDDLIEETAIPKTKTNGSSARIAVDSIFIPEDSSTSNYLVVGLIDKLEKNSKIDTKAVLGGAANIYSSGDTLLTARSIYHNETSGSRFGVDTAIAFNGGKSEILAFSLKDGTVRLTARGIVDGTLLNQFSMDESDGYYRIATTDSKANNLFVLDKDLKVKGSVTGFAQGEQIKSVRFMGKTAYVVTFVQTDPLFVIDLSNPEKPVIRGELKIPGFSEYLHPIGNNLLIGIGRDGTMTGVNENAKISLFDVSDPASPKELHFISLKNSYINTEHKAFLTIPERNMYLIPVYKTIYDANYVYELSCLTTFSIENGRIVMKDTYSPEGARSNLRGTYIGKTIYAIDTDSGVWAIDMDSKEMLDTINF